jgi:hypothetical protein
MSHAYGVAPFGDETRSSLVARLSVDGPLSIVRPAEGAGITRQAITDQVPGKWDAALDRLPEFVDPCVSDQAAAPATKASTARCRSCKRRSVRGARSM